MFFVEDAADEVEYTSGDRLSQFESRRFGFMSGGTELRSGHNFATGVFFSVRNVSSGVFGNRTGAEITRRMPIEVPRKISIPTRNASRGVAVIVSRRRESRKELESPHQASPFSCQFLRVERNHESMAISTRRNCFGTLNSMFSSNPRFSSYARETSNNSSLGTLSLGVSRTSIKRCTDTWSASVSLHKCQMPFSFYRNQGDV